MPGTVVTFYSYKGGVGRSFTLANIAILLARWGHRVLTIDWDLEAPGLHQYFAPLMADPPAAGIVDLADDFAAGVARPATAYLTKLDAGESGVVDLIAAGRRDTTYASRVQAIDWALLYKHGFADFLERCRSEWIEGYDFVLIDSRTGIADTAGICTAHLPDRLVVVFTANEQSVGGAVDIATRADAARDRMPYDRPQLTILPILSRVDSRVEYKRAEEWHRRCAELTAPLFRNWLVRNVSADQMLRHLTLPYVSYWSFGEQLPVREEPVPSADQIAFALETVAAIIAHQFDRTDLLADNRDAYVAEARTRGREFERDIRVSSPRSALPLAGDLVEELRRLGVRVAPSLSADPEYLDLARDSARHLCLVVDGQVSRWQVAEAERFLRHTLGSRGDRLLFPVLTPHADPAQLPGFLRNLQYLRLGAGTGPREVARELHASLKDKDLAPVDVDGQVFRDAATALRQLRPRGLHDTRWDVVEQAALAMADAIARGDPESVRDLTVVLERVGRTHPKSDRVTEAPVAVRRVIANLLDTLDPLIGK
jgi:cellulose biosynthesis protein BcsQ